MIELATAAQLDCVRPPVRAAIGFCPHRRAHGQHHHPRRDRRHRARGNSPQHHVDALRSQPRLSAHKSTMSSSICSFSEMVPTQPNNDRTDPHVLGYFEEPVLRKSRMGSPQRTGSPPPPERSGRRPCSTANTNLLGMAPLPAPQHRRNIEACHVTCWASWPTHSNANAGMWRTRPAGGGRAQAVLQPCCLVVSKSHPRARPHLAVEQARMRAHARTCAQQVQQLLEPREGSTKAHLSPPAHPSTTCKKPGRSEPCIVPRCDDIA